MAKLCHGADNPLKAVKMSKWPFRCSKIVIAMTLIPSAAARRPIDRGSVPAVFDQGGQLCDHYSQIDIEKSPKHTNGLTTTSKSETILMIGWYCCLLTDAGIEPAIS
jgi:hypothetical protein